MVLYQMILKLQLIKHLGSALTGLLIIVVGGFLPAAIIFPGASLTLVNIDLASSWQVPGLLLCALICGPRTGIISTFAYLTIGLFFLPVFHGGGSIGYLATPDFGYLAGFVPGVWMTGRLAEMYKNDSIRSLFKCTFVGLTVIHSIGIINLMFGTLLARWEEPFLELLLTYSLSTYFIQLLICPAIVLLARILRKTLIIE